MPFVKKEKPKDGNIVVDAAYNSIRMFAEVQLLKKRPGDRFNKCWAEVLADTLIRECEKGNMKAFEQLTKLLQPKQQIAPSDVIRFLTLYSSSEIKKFLNMTDSELAVLENKVTESKLILSGEVDSESDANN